MTVRVFFLNPVRNLNLDVVDTCAQELRKLRVGRASLL